MTFTLGYEVSPESNRNFYERRAVADGLLLDRITAGERRLEAYIRATPGTLLDIGCGSGRLDHALARPGHVGIDYAGMQLRTYRHQRSDANLVQGSALHLPFQCGSFDVAVMSYHLVESILPRSARQLALSEAARVLRPTGILFLTRHRRLVYKFREQVADRAIGRVHEFGDLIGRGTSRAGGNDLTGISMHILSGREMRAIAKSAGLARQFTWDFDSGYGKKARSRAVVECYRNTSI